MQFNALFTIVSAAIALLGLFMAVDTYWLAPQHSDIINLNSYIALIILAVTNFSTLLLNASLLSMGSSYHWLKTLVGAQIVGVVVTLLIAMYIFLL